MPTCMHGSATCKRTGVDMILMASLGRLSSSTGTTSIARNTSAPPTSLCGSAQHGVSTCVSCNGTHHYQQRTFRTRCVSCRDGCTT